MRIQAYFEEWSRQPGDKVRMAISTVHPTIEATLERVTSGPGDPADPATSTEPRHDVLATSIPGRTQTTAVGSYAELPLSLQGLSAPAAVHLWFFATTPTLQRRQVILGIGHAGQVVLEIADGELALLGPLGRFKVLEAVQAQTWYSVCIQFDGANAAVDLAPVAGFTPENRRRQASGIVGTPDWSMLRVATGTVSDGGSPEQAFNGKVENPSLFSHALSEGQCNDLHSHNPVFADKLLAWDFSQDMASLHVVETVRGDRSGRIFNGGDRAVTGHSWTGKSDSFIQAPSQYAAIHFHDDDMLEAGWEYDLEFFLPEDLRSGVYLVRLTAGGDVYRYPLFVRGRAQEVAKILFLLPTNSYIAYANDRLATLDFSAVLGNREIIVPEDERYLHLHPEFGRSCYDTHNDGSPVRFASRRRCLINVRPEYRNFLTGTYRHFAADMYILEWLERSGLQYHVATDEDVEREGIDLFSRYQTIVTGSHPEYWTWRGRDELETFLNDGGRLMYLGGNGFYWVTTLDPDRPWVVEVRRDNSGTRGWDAPPGERGHLFSGEPGGIWRLRGLAPNKLVGVGFSAWGMTAAQPFRRLPASYTGPASVWFEGIDAESIGTDGHILGGAVGDEVDRFDLSLGSPVHTHVLGVADGWDAAYSGVLEEALFGESSETKKANMVYFTIAGGGAVFSAGSIAYCGALAWNDFNNDLATVTTRVLRSFCSALPT